MLKKLFGKSGAQPTESELSIEDLIVLERWEDAIVRLESRLKDLPNDLHSHLRLAEVYAQLGKGTLALDQFLFVADSYTDDGFYDKALALLAKVAKLVPGDESVRAKMLRNQRLKSLEHSRSMAIEGLVHAQKEWDPLARTSPIEVERIWQTLAATSLVERLPGEQLKRLFTGCELELVERGNVLAERGARDEFLLIVVSGAVEAVLDVPGERQFQLRVLVPGDVFGEGALLEHRPWPATYRTLERSKFVRVSAAGLETALRGNPDPRCLLDALRAQHADRDVADATAKLLRPKPE